MKNEREVTLPSTHRGRLFRKIRGKVAESALKKKTEKREKEEKKTVDVTGDAILTSQTLSD